MNAFSARLATPSVLLAGVLLLGGCASGGGVGAPLPEAAGLVRIKGSDTMLILNRRLAEAFMETHSGVAVQVEGGGSGAGVAALVAGEVDICAASRPLAPAEVEALYDRYQTLGVRFLVGQDALSIYLNPSNTVRDLSLEELRGLFEGRIRSWKELGGPDLAVRVVLRPPSSGTYRFLQAHVLEDAPYRADGVTVLRTVDVVATVMADPRAVGYGGIAYSTARVARARIDGVEATVDAVRRGDYPLSRYLQYSTVAPPEGVVKVFIDWVLGPEGQRLVGEVGYVPLWDYPKRPVM